MPRPLLSPSARGGGSSWLNSPPRALQRIFKPASDIAGEMSRPGAPELPGRREVAAIQMSQAGGVAEGVGPPLPSQAYPPAPPPAASSPLLSGVSQPAGGPAPPALGFATAGGISYGAPGASGSAQWTAQQAAMYPQQQQQQLQEQQAAAARGRSPLTAPGPSPLTAGGPMGYEATMPGQPWQGYVPQDYPSQGYPAQPGAAVGTGQYYPPGQPPYGGARGAGVGQYPAVPGADPRLQRVPLPAGQPLPAITAAPAVSPLAAAAAASEGGQPGLRSQPSRLRMPLSGGSFRSPPKITGRDPRAYYDRVPMRVSENVDIFKNGDAGWLALAASAFYNPLQPHPKRWAFDHSKGYRICLDGISGIELGFVPGGALDPRNTPPEWLRQSSMHPETLQCRVVLRFLDGRTGAFFGNDFVTRNVDLVRESNGTYRAPFEQDVFFHTRLFDHQVQLFVEVQLVQKGSGAQAQAQAQGGRPLQDVTNAGAGADMETGPSRGAYPGTAQAGGQAQAQVTMEVVQGYQQQLAAQMQQATAAGYAPELLSQLKAQQEAALAQLWQMFLAQNPEYVREAEEQRRAQQGAGAAGQRGATGGAQAAAAQAPTGATSGAQAAAAQPQRAATGAAQTAATQPSKGAGPSAAAAAASTGKAQGKPLDPDRAATRIQSVYRGSRDRKELSRAQGGKAARAAQSAGPAAKGEAGKGGAQGKPLPPVGAGGAGPAQASGMPAGSSTAGQAGGLPVAGQGAGLPPLGPRPGAASEITAKDGSPGSLGAGSLGAGSVGGGSVGAGSLGAGSRVSGTGVQGQGSGTSGTSPLLAGGSQGSVGDSAAGAGSGKLPPFPGSGPAAGSAGGSAGGRPAQLAPLKGTGGPLYSAVVKGSGPVAEAKETDKTASGQPAKKGLFGFSLSRGARNTEASGSAPAATPGGPAPAQGAPGVPSGSAPQQPGMVAQAAAQGYAQAAGQGYAQAGAATAPLPAAIMTQGYGPAGAATAPLPAAAMTQGYNPMGATALGSSDPRSMVGAQGQPAASAQPGTAGQPQPLPGQAYPGTQQPQPLPGQAYAGAQQAQGQPLPGQAYPGTQQPLPGQANTGAGAHQLQPQPLPGQTYPGTQQPQGQPGQPLPASHAGAQHQAAGGQPGAYPIAAGAAYPVAPVGGYPAPGVSQPQAAARGAVQGAPYAGPAQVPPVAGGYPAPAPAPAQAVPGQPGPGAAAKQSPTKQPWFGRRKEEKAAKAAAKKGAASAAAPTPSPLAPASQPAQPQAAGAQLPGRPGPGQQPQWRAPAPAPAPVPAPKAGQRAGATAEVFATVHWCVLPLFPKTSKTERVNMQLRRAVAKPGKAPEDESGLRYKQGRNLTLATTLRKKGAGEYPGEDGNADVGEGMVGLVKDVVWDAMERVVTSVVAIRLQTQLREACRTGPFEYQLLAEAKARLTTTQRLGKLISSDARRSATCCVMASMSADQRTLKLQRNVPENYLFASSSFIPGIVRKRQDGRISTEASFTTLFLQVSPRPAPCKALAAHLRSFRAVLAKAVRAQLRAKTGGRGRYLLRVTATNGLFWLNKPALFDALSASDLSGQGQPDNELVGMPVSEALEVLPLPSDPYTALFVELVWSANPLRKGEAPPPIEGAPQMADDKRRMLEGRPSQRRSWRTLTGAGSTPDSQQPPVEVPCPKEAGTWPVPLATMSYQPPRPDQARPGDLTGYVGVVSTTEVVAWTVLFPFDPNTCDPETPEVGFRTGPLQARMRGDLVPWSISRKADVDLRAAEGVSMALELSAIPGRDPYLSEEMQQLRREWAGEASKEPRGSLAAMAGRDPRRLLEAAGPAGPGQAEDAAMQEYWERQALLAEQERALLSMQDQVRQQQMQVEARQREQMTYEQYQRYQEEQQRRGAGQAAAPLAPGPSTAVGDVRSPVGVRDSDASMVALRTLADQQRAHEAAIRAMHAHLQATAAQGAPNAQYQQALQVQMQQMLQQLAVVQHQMAALHQQTSAALMARQGPASDHAQNLQRVQVADLQRKQRALLEGAAASTVQRSVRGMLQKRGWQPTRPPTINGRAVDPSYYVKQAYPTAAAVPHPEMTREEFERLARMPPTTYAGGTQAWGSPLTYSGAPPAPGAETYDPSRADKARVYSRAIDDALPKDMASVLRHPGALHALDAHAVARRLRGAVDLSLETMDDLDANDVVLQFVAVRRSGGAVPQKVYFTTRFFDCGPAVSEIASVAVDPADPGLAWVLGGGGTHTGVACKFAIDDDDEGLDAETGGRRAGLIRYLAGRSLHVDMWDGDSLMHLGTVSVPLIGALRQGRPACETLLSVPLDVPVTHNLAPVEGTPSPLSHPPQGAATAREVLENAPPDYATVPHDFSARGHPGDHRPREPYPGYYHPAVSGAHPAGAPGHEISPLAAALAKQQDPAAPAAPSTTRSPLLGAVNAPGTVYGPGPVTGPVPGFGPTAASSPLQAAVVAQAASAGMPPGPAVTGYAGPGPHSAYGVAAPYGAGGLAQGPVQGLYAPPTVSPLAAAATQAHSAPVPHTAAPPYAPPTVSPLAAAAAQPYGVAMPRTGAPSHAPTTSPLMAAAQAQAASHHRLGPGPVAESVAPPGPVAEAGPLSPNQVQRRTPAQPPAASRTAATPTRVPAGTPTGRSSQATAPTTSGGASRPTSPARQHAQAGHAHMAQQPMWVPQQQGPATTSGYPYGSAGGAAAHQGWYAGGAMSGAGAPAGAYAPAQAPVPARAVVAAPDPSSATPLSDAGPLGELPLESRIKGHVIVRLLCVGRKSDRLATRRPARVEEVDEAVGVTSTASGKLRVREMDLAAAADVDARRRREGHVAEMARMAGVPSTDARAHTDGAATAARERERVRSQAISQQLQRRLGRTFRGPCRLGQALLVEYELSNDTSAPMVVAIESQDPGDMTVVTDVGEWRRLRAQCIARGALWGLCRPPGAEGRAWVPGGPGSGGGEGVNMPKAAQGAGVTATATAVGGDEVSDGRTVFLAPKERVVVPFRVQLVRGQLPPPGQALALRATFTHVQARRVVGAMEVQCLVAPLVVDRTFRFKAGEGEIMHRSLDLAHLPPVLSMEHPLAGNQGQPYGPYATLARPTARCSSSDRASVSVAGMVVSIKARCGKAPEMMQFLVCLYADVDADEPLETWEVFVHCLRRTDVRCHAGETTSMPLLIKGLGHSHAVRAYVSHADEVDVKPDAFTLPASGLFELTARVRPLRAFGRMDALVHLVDQQTRELVHALVITADVGLPCITRAFECEVPRGTSVQKKFSYQNRYSRPRRFFLHTSHPQLVQLRRGVVEAAAGEVVEVGLAINARMETRPGIVEALIYINDEDDRSEDCIRVRVSVLQ